uniref:26S proteasome non-ATPase regulatory subunit 13 n=1 Tax=Strongyloides stercoralis TaxID=6248 RepID=A0A0K0EKY7_STRER
MSLDFNKPSCLRQRLVEVSSERCNLSYAFGLSEYKDGSTRTGKYLYDCEGKCKYFVVAIEGYLLLYNSLDVYDEPKKRVEYSFGKGAVIHDCALMALKDGLEGLVAGVTTINENGGKNYNLYLLNAGREAIILDALTFSDDCKKVFVIYDELHQDELKGLNSAFHEFPHLIMVGGQGAKGYLTHFNNTSMENALDDRPPSRGIQVFNILRGFRDKTEKYFCFDDYKESIKLKLTDTELTSIAYVNSCRCLLLGFNFGGILSINLLTQCKNKIVLSRGEIRAMQVQEPDDDPRPASYVWVASVNGRSLCFSMLSLRFYSDPSDPSIVDRNKMELSERLSFKAAELCHFLSLKVVTRERTMKLDNTTKLEDIHKKDTTLMLFTWINFSSRGTTLEGALFDLNIYYYKRMCSQIRDDGTYARQCPMISRFSIDSAEGINFASLLDAHLDSGSLYRGRSDLIENVDQFFYPSTYGFELRAFSKSIALVFSCKPIQFQFFEHLSPLKEHLNNPDMTVRCLTALGFISDKDSIKLTEISDKCSFILSTLLHNYSGNLIVQLINDETVTEKHLLPLIDWLYNEIQKCIDHFQNIVSKLFEENSEDLYSTQITKVNHYIGVFEMMREIIIAMREKELSEEVNGQLYVKGVVIDTFLFYSRLMNVFVEVKLFPITPEVIELHNSLEKLYNDRLALSRRKMYKLEISKLLDLFEATDLDCIEKLYPPKNPAVLIDLIVAPEVTIVGKTKLISYYALDIGLLMGNDSFIDKVQYNVAFFCRDKDPIDFFEIKKTWRQDAIELEHYNPNSHTLRHINFDFDYKTNLTPRSVERISQKVYISNEEMKDLRNYLLKQPYGLFIWNYIVIKRGEFSMIEPLNTNSFSGISEEWRAFCENAKKLYEETKGCSILWRYKMPSLYSKKNLSKKENSTLLSYIPPHEKSQDTSEVISSEKKKDIDTVIDKDYLECQFAARKYGSLLKTPLSASRWTRVSRIKNTNISPPPSEQKQIQPTSIMKSQERVSRIRQGMKIGSRIRFNLPEVSSTIETTNGDSICSLEKDNSMNASFNGVFQIEKSDEKTEFDDVKCVYKTVIQDKIEEQMSKTIRYEDGKVTEMEVQTDEEMLMSDLENSPAKTATDLINHMEERSKIYNIDLPNVVLVQPSNEEENVEEEEGTPVLKRRRSCVIQKTLSFTEKKYSYEEVVSVEDNMDDNTENANNKNDNNKDVKTKKLKRNSACEDLDDEDNLYGKKTKLDDDIIQTPPNNDEVNQSPPSNDEVNQSPPNNESNQSTPENDTNQTTPENDTNQTTSDNDINQSTPEHDINQTTPDDDTSNSALRRSSRIRNKSVEPEIPSVPVTKSRTRRGKESRETSVEANETTSSKGRPKRGKGSRETSVEANEITSSKGRPKRGKGSRETSVEGDETTSSKSRTRRVKESRENSVEGDDTTTKKTKTRRGKGSRETSVEGDETTSSKTRTRRSKATRETNTESTEVTSSKTRTRRGKASRETSVEVDENALSKTDTKLGKENDETSVESTEVTSSKTRTRRGKASRETSVEPDASVPSKTRTRRGKASRENSIEPEVPSTPKSRSRRGSSCEQETDLRRSTRLRKTPSKEFDNSTKKVSKSASRLPTIVESAAAPSETQN